MSKRAVIIVLVSLVLSCQHYPASTPMNQWDRFVHDFIEGYFAAHPTVAVGAGRHEYDGKLPDWSRAGLEGEARRLQGLRSQALAFDAARLDERQRFERDYLVAVIDSDLFWLQTARWPYRSPLFYSGALDPSVYITRPYAPLEQRMRAYVQYLKGIPGATAQIRANLSTPLPRSYIEVARNVYAGYGTYFKDDVPPIFASTGDERLAAEFRSATDQAFLAMHDLANWLEAQLPDATSDFALGPELFRSMLISTERVDVPLDELERIARSDLERNLSMLRRACERLAPGATIPQCVDRVAANKPEGGPVEGARRQLTQLRRFVEEKQLVSIPGTEEAKVEEAPPYNRWNFAYIDIPGPYEKNMPSVYYIAPPDPTWSEEARADYIPGEADLLATSVHEVWPGHFLQFLHANRAPSKFGQVFVGYAFAEGWAHYTEEMVVEAGLGNGDPEIHIGQLLNALLRNVRFLSALGLHTKGMSVEESQRMFRELAYQDEGNAQQQARRGTFDPAYLNYTMGKLMILKLREDWTASRGGRAAWRQFHDQFLSYGGPPIPLVRRAMVGDSGDLFPR
jgi:hypothetical protein